MAVVQNTYNEYIGDGYNGQQASTLDNDVSSRIVETAAGIPFGVAVSQGTADNGVVVGVSGGKYVGITVRDRSIRPEDTTGTGAAKEAIQLFGYHAGVATRGEYFVEVESAVAAGADVTANTATGKLSNAGVDATHLKVDGARWMTTQATVGGLAVIRLDGSVTTS